nr:tyrosine-type recombinase/integrase [Sporomusa acidovorans]OZC19513.1 tyrosine recombinase XerD [Sporomusa acidovorans DSM 3132]
MKNLLRIFIREKQMTGFKYKTQVKELERFDAYYYYNGYGGTSLTKSMLDSFIYGEFEKPSTHYKKEILMRDFAEFLGRHGYPVYVPLAKSAPQKKNPHIPYIFTQKQLYKLFMKVDSYPLEKTNNRNVLDPVLFRLLYGSGLRVSEALNLQLQDIDLTQKVLIIRHAKNNKDRLVPIAKSLTERIQCLLDTYHRFSADTSFLFPSITGNRMDKSTVYRRFRDYLLMADIPHTSAGPRVHDLRHTFAVCCLKKWVLSGAELMNALPYLSAYMGHTDFRATQYYLRLTADLYPDLVSRTEAEFGYVIPEGGWSYEGK